MATMGGICTLVVWGSWHSWCIAWDISPYVRACRMLVGGHPCAAKVLAPLESSVAKEETPCTFNRFFALRRWQFMQSGWVTEKVTYVLNFVIALRNAWAGWGGVKLDL